MALLLLAVGLSAAGSLVGLLLASSFLLIADRLRARLVSSLLSFAVGTLLGAALLKLTPEALVGLPSTHVLGSVLAGIFTFFVLERTVVWRHCHEGEECLVHSSTAPLLIIGDAVHSFVDGAIIAAAVMTSVPLGVSTAAAVIAHEVPQELGDFAILLGAGYSRRRALLLNVAAGSAGVAGAVAAYFAASALPSALPYLLGFAAGNFLYVAMADLIPNLHRGPLDESPWRQTLLLAAGVALLVAL